jgi:hypothetical protein
MFSLLFLLDDGKILIREALKLLDLDSDTGYGFVYAHSDPQKFHIRLYLLSQHDQ